MSIFNEQKLKWDMVPDELKPFCYDLNNITMEKMEYLFKRAEKLNALEQFSDCFWTSLALVNDGRAKDAVQDCLDELEDRRDRYEQLLNKPYAYVSKRYLTMCYNDCEYDIRYLVARYGAERRTKPNLLEEDEDDV